ncbi:MAG: outer membrane lipoprotein carrier protein LolA [Rhodospirillales bacterium]
MIIGLSFLIAGALLPAEAAAPSPADLSKAERETVSRIEAYLNRLETMQSRFLQISSDGAYSEGDIFLSRPGKMRIEYDPPMPVLIIADGRQLIYFDRKLNQVSYIGLDSSPAGILLGENVSFLSGDLTITRFERGANSVRLSLVRNEDPQEGELTLVFSDNPLALKKWIVTDGQGIVTTITLMGVRFGAPLNPELFHFKRPDVRDDS